MSFSITPCKSLSTSDIYKLLSKDEYAKKDFKSVLPYDCLPPRPQYPSSYGIYTDSAGEKGEHWLALYYDKNGECTFFDSFGVQNILGWTNILKEHQQDLNTTIDKYNLYPPQHVVIIAFTLSF